MAEDVNLRFLGEQIKHLQADVRQIKMCIIARDNQLKVDGSDLAALKARMYWIEKSYAALKDYADDRMIELLRASFQALKDEIEPIVTSRVRTTK
jgi:predicted Mrr-cat superfamily restriction endonuclease